MQLNELDLKDVSVLQDQLIGVDSAYFDMVIGAIRSKKKKKEPEWQIDNSYVFELINRIF